MSSRCAGVLSEEDLREVFHWPEPRGWIPLVGTLIGIGTPRRVAGAPGDGT